MPVLEYHHLARQHFSQFLCHVIDNSKITELLQAIAITLNYWSCNQIKGAYDEEKNYFGVIRPLLPLHFLLPSFATAAFTQTSHGVVIILLFQKILSEEKVWILYSVGT